MTEEVPKEHQLHILFHSLGLDDNGHGREYRNSYCQPIDFESDSLKYILALVELGYMAPGMKINEDRDQYFHVTTKGRSLARESAKPTTKLSRSQLRYREFLDLDAGISFKEFLTTYRA